MNSLILHVFKILSAKKWTLSTAESCTGGLLATFFTEIPGSTQIYEGGISAYSIDAKKNLLKISTKKLKQHTAVSEEIACDMAKKIRRMLKTDFSLSITGYAGPRVADDGSFPKQSVGLVWIGFSSKKKTYAVKCLFAGSRKKIRTNAARKALEILLKEIKAKKC